MTTALLALDMQVSIVERHGNEALVERVASIAEVARAAGLPVVFVRVGFRPGYPEISPNNKTFRAIAAAGTLVDGAPGSRFHPGLTLDDSDLVVTKRRVSAFAGSDLEVVLRSRGVHTVVLTGVATGGVVLSTVRAAADADFEIVVLRDACSDMDAELHEVLVERVFPNQASVVRASEWTTSLGDSERMSNDTDV